ncbi:transcriptional regulator, MerR family, partial [Streptomyces ipomoeae 91-03]
MSRAMSRRAIASVLGTLMVATVVSQVPASAAQSQPVPLPKPIKQATAQWTLKFSGASRTNVP